MRPDDSTLFETFVEIPNNISKKIEKLTNSST